MKTKAFAEKTLDDIRKSLVIGIRAGSKPHRVIAVWAVVTDGRVFIRSWSRKERSWYRAFREEPRGIMTVSDRTIRVQAKFTRSERVKDAVDAAYAEKYKTPASKEYVRGLCGAESRETTTELVLLYPARR